MVAGGTVDETDWSSSDKTNQYGGTWNLVNLPWTHYRVKEKFRAHTYIRLKLESGRTHQISGAYVALTLSLGR